MDVKLTIAQEIALFKKINGENKKPFSEHTNFSRGSNEKNAIFNQGIARAKLREYVTKGDLTLEQWL